MSTTTQKQQVLKGGEWLIKESSAFETFIPEEYNEEQQMVKDMCPTFLDNEVLPIIDRMLKAITCPLPISPRRLSMSRRS